MNFSSVLSYECNEASQLRKNVATQLATKKQYLKDLKFLACLDFNEEVEDAMTEHQKVVLSINKIIRSSISRIRYLRYKRKQINNLFKKILTKTTNYYSLENKVLAIKVFNFDKPYIKSVLVKVKELLQVYNLNKIQQQVAAAKLRAEIKNNKHNFNLLQIEDDLEEVDDSSKYYDDFANVYRYNSNVLKKKTKFIFSSELRPNGTIPIPTEIKRTRNIFLLDRIKALISLFRSNRSRGTIHTIPVYSHIIDKLNSIYNTEHTFDETGIEMTELNSELGIFQMDKPDAQGEGTVIKVSAGNVEITESQGESIAVTVEKPIDWTSYVSSDVVGTFGQMTDRWLKFANIEWTVSQNKQGTILNDITLPKDIIKNAQFKMCDVPNLIPFKVHRYWCGDMEIKMQINSNKFQIGQLMCCWWYETNMDANFKMRKNVFCGSQTSHVLISAGSSNEATFKIPYRHHMPMIPTCPRSDISDHLNLGSLVIFVLNPLTVATGGPDSCFGSIFARFIDSKFTGQISGALAEKAEFQMEKAVLNAATGLLSGLCPNMDNIQDTTNPQYVVPIAAHSWSFGTGISEPLQSLRLDPKGVTQHPDKISSESLISNIIQKYGLIKTIDWTNKEIHKQGALLFDCDAAPMLEASKYKNGPSVSDKNLNTYYIPPVGVISNLFNFWRGNLRFKFDIVASQFHTGRLLVGYVPGVLSSQVVTMDMVLSGPHMVFTLQESEQFVYQIPYIADRPFWSKKYQGNYKEDQVLAPSRLYVFVLNKLIPMQSVSDKVYINIYMAASSAFEFSIPVQPAIGLGWDSEVLYSNSEVIRCLNQSYYPGVWHSFDNSRSLVMRHTDISEGVASWDTSFLKKSKYDPVSKKFVGYYYELQDKSKSCRALLANGTWVSCTIGVLIWGDVKKTYAIMVPVKDKDFAILCVGKYSSQLDGNDIVPYSFRAGSTTGNSWCLGNPNWVAQICEGQLKQDDFELIEEADFEGEREEGMNVIISGSVLNSTNNGKNFYGESFHDLKDLMRRYQTYCSFQINGSKLTQLGQSMANIPLLPQGLMLNIGTPSQIIEFSNRCREGHIPIILSGFRYYRGGMRLRILFPTTKDLNAWIQHRPDRKLITPTVRICENVDSGNCMANHSYATFIQDCGVNSIVQVEIPYYKNNAFNLLQTPVSTTNDESFHTTLGEAVIGGFFGKTEVKNLDNYTISLYYAIADDFHPSVFQGFPPMVLCDDIKTQTEIAEFQGLFDYVKKKTVEGIKEEVSVTIQDSVDTATEKITSQLDGFKQYITDSSFSGLLNVPLFRSIISQLAHVWANFNIKSVCLAIASVLIEIGLFAMDSVKAVIDQVKLFVLWVQQQTRTSGNEPKQPDVVEVGEEVGAFNMETSSDSDAAVGLITMLWTAVCSVFSVVNNKPRDIKSLTKLLTQDLSGVFRSANGLFVFLRNIFSVLDAIKLKIYGLVSPNYARIKFLKDSHAELKAWCQEVIVLENPAKFEKEKYTQEYKSRVSIAFTKGQLLYKTITDVQDSKICKLITDFYKKIRDLREKMLDFGDDSFVRLEPYVIWQCGPPGIGKSFATTELICDLLKSRGLIFNVPPIYVHEASSDFWDACNNNPGMVIDDIFNVQEGDMLYKDLALLFSVVSPVILVPPKARLEDKGRPYNPKIVVINSNYEYLSINNVNKDAVNRRRNKLIKYVINKNINKIPKVCFHCDSLRGKEDAWIEANISKVISQTPSSHLKDMHHILISEANNVLREDQYSEPISWVEFMKNIKKDFNVAMDKHEESYRDRSEKILSLLEFDPTKQDFQFDDMEKAYVTIAQRQQREFKELVESSIIGQFRSAYAATSDGFSKAVTKSCLFMCNLLPKNRRKGILSKQRLDTTVGIKDENGSDISVTDYLEQIWGEFQSGGDEALRTYKYNYHDFKNRIQSIKGLSDLEFCHTIGENISDYSNHLSKSLNMRMRQFDFHQFLLLSSLGESHFLNKIEIVEHLLKLGKYNAPFSHAPSVFRWSDFFGTLKHVPTYDLIRAGYGLSEGDLDILKYKNSRCFHYNLFADWDIVYDHKKEIFFSGEDRVNRSCCLEDGSENSICLWNFLPYQHYFYSEYVLYNRDVLDKVKFKSNLKTTPKVFHPLCITPEEIEDPTLFATICDTIMLKYQQMVDKICRISPVAWGCIKTIAKVLAIYVAILGLGYMVGTGLDRVFNSPKVPEWEILQHQSPTYSMNKNISLNKTVPLATHQSNIPQLDVVIKRIIDNTFQITACYDDRKLSCTGVVLENRTLLLLRHFVEEFNTLPPYTVFYGKFSLRKDEFVNVLGLELNYRDLIFKSFNRISSSGHYASNYILCELPLKFPCCKNLTKFIASQKKHQLVRGNGVLVQNNGFIHQNLYLVRENTRPLTINGTDNMETVVLQDMYSYKMQGKGMCGSILLSDNLEMPIIGMHVAGIEKGNVRGIAEPLTYEMFGTILEKEKEYTDTFIPVMSDPEFASIKVNSLLYPCGSVDSSKLVFQSQETNIIPSLIQGVFPVTMHPGPLSKNDPRLPKGSLPLEDGIAHMGKPPKDFNQQDLYEAGEDYLCVLKSHVKPLRKVGVLSYQDAVCGIVGITGYEPLEWSTSPGFPLRFHKDNSQQTGKKWLFDLEETNDGLKLLGFHPLLKEALSIDVNLRERGIKPFTVFIDCLKDHVMADEKCSIPGKTRIFSISPVQFTIEFKRYFNDFTAAFHNSRLDANHAIGIDVNSHEWSELTSRLIGKGSKMVCGDYKNYGPGLMLIAAKKAFDLILDWYAFHGDEKNNNIRRIMVSEVVNAYHLAKDLIYTCPCGIPSGSPITTPLNTIVGALYIRVCWKYTTNLDFRSMNELTYHCIVGDDIIIGVNESIISSFNTSKIGEFFSTYNIVFTDTDKLGNTIPYRTLKEASFLKCGFASHPSRIGLWLAPLDKRSIENCPNWINKRNNHLEATVENCKQTLELAHGWGKQYYNYVQEKLLKSMSDINQTFPTLSWEDIDRRRYTM